MEFLSSNNADYYISKAKGIVISNEQSNIMNNNLSHPMLVNAIAGSGKTTTFMLRAMKLILTGKLKPFEILGITFSKKSQMDMKQKYKNSILDINKTMKNKDELNYFLNRYKPTFSTFHALFFGLLRVGNFHGKLNVLSNTIDVRQAIYSLIDNKADPGSKKEIYDKIFQLKDQLTNLNYSTNGLDFSLNGEDFEDASSYDSFSTMLDKVMEIEPNIEANNIRKKNYYKAIKEYNNYKTNNGFIDFGDMKSLLLKDLKYKNRLEFYRNKMSNCKYVVLDEFQDIDNVQWKIITSLLSKDALNSLTVIGDDDQSIYSFRGSNPKYILNYSDYMKDVSDKDTIHKTLSTNYRTGGRILNSVVPMIEKNKLRIDKNINAYSSNLNHGNIYLSTNINMYMGKLIADLSDKSIDNKEIVVLTRYDDSKMILCDRLADNNIYISMKKSSKIIQNNIYYESLIRGLLAFYFDDLNQFTKLSGQIGFSQYKNYVNNISKNCENSIESYMEKSSEYIKKSDEKVSMSKAILCDKKVENTFKNIQKIKDKIENKKGSKEFSDLISDIFYELKSIVKDYFKYMSKQRFMSKNTTDKIDNYLSTYVYGLWKSEQDISIFLKNSNRKKEILNSSELIRTYNKNNNNIKNIQFLSIHQSKGLEFKNVYLLDSNNKDINDNVMELSRMFNIEMSEKEFYDIIIKMPENMVRMLEKIYICEKLRFSGYKNLADKTYKNHFKFMSYTKRKNKYSKGQHVSFLQQTIKYLDGLKDFTLAEKSYQKYLRLLYIQTVNTLKNIEEERRLLYVAITRAKDNLYLDLPINPIPMLKELDLYNSYQLSNSDSHKNGYEFLKAWENSVESAKKNDIGYTALLNPIELSYESKKE